MAAAAVIGLAAVSALASGGAPTVETEHPTGVGRTSMVLDGTVDPNGSPVSECYFEYGTSEESLSSRAACSYSPGEGETPVPVLATVEGLSETTTYFFRLHAKSGAGESSGGIREVTTDPTAPYTNTEQPSAVGHTSITLTGLVDPNDAEVTECAFEWGTDPDALTNKAACAPSPGSGSEPVTVQATLTGLAESTVYYYRVEAKNSFGSTHGGRSRVETLPSAPHSNTEPAAEVGHTTATLRGFVTPNGSMIKSCYFEWGSSSVEEHTSPCEQMELGSGEAPVAVTAKLSGLSESTTYHFRLVAANVHGSTVGGGEGFTTLPYVPKVLIGRATELSAETAELRAKVDPQDEAITQCTFEYGTTPALGEKASCDTLPPAGERYVQVSAHVSGLAPTTTYLYRIKAVDASGPTYSRLEPFTTFKAGLRPVVAKLRPSKGSSAGGTVVTIKGEDLLGAESVSFGETETTDITSDLADSLTVVAPPGVGTVDVVVTTEDGDSAIVPADQYRYGKPSIASVSPGNGPVAGGTPVTVTGSGFEPGTSGTTFLFGKNAATSVECASSSSCTMDTPAASKGKAGRVKVQAKVGGEASSSAPGATFAYEG